MLHLFASFIVISGLASADNMKYMTSDSKMTCARGDFKLELQFDGTGDNVNYAWNGAPGTSPVDWKGDVATFGLNDAENGPFSLVFKNSTFYFQNVPCTEEF